jgi:hypothetical protein
MFLVCVRWYASASRSGAPARRSRYPELLQGQQASVCANNVEQDRVDTHFADAELQVGYVLPGMDFDRPGLRAFRNSRVVRRPADVVFHVKPFGSEQIFFPGRT